MRLRRRRALNPRLARGMGGFSAVRQQALRALLHRFVDHVVLAQTTQPLARLLLHPGIAARLGATHATRSGDPEPLDRGLLRLHLRHGADPRETALWSVDAKASPPP